MWLIGMMGSGKSTIGGLVADRVGVPFYDTDLMVEERAGRSITEIWSELGEDGFRRMESQAVRAVPPGRKVVAAGGGAVLDSSNREIIARSDVIVWLRADPATLAKRLAETSNRPLLARTPEKTLPTLLGERSRLYSGLATHEVDTEDRTIDDVVDQVVGIWHT